MTTDLLTVPEVAEILRVDATTVRRHIRTGAIPASKPCGVVRIARVDLDAYLAAARVRPQITPPATRPSPPRSVARQSASSPSSARERLRARRAA